MEKKQSCKLNSLTIRVLLPIPKFKKYLINNKSSIIYE